MSRRRSQSSTQNLVDSRFTLNGAPWIDAQTREKFDSNLRAFLRANIPHAKLRDDGEEQILIRRCDCVHLHYTSAEDWMDKVDLMRCNPDFGTNGDERFDCVNVNLDPNTLDFARLLYLFRCCIPGMIDARKTSLLSASSNHHSGSRRRTAAYWRTAARWFLRAGN
ncbi:hypothetical protein GGX14DRAFT_553380 [Mycena pura]|uniref:Uncharacterized protein n=1 Tax=Mycena pura TaxID=153505 RepID=A0AAD6YUJ8_9AGAR|nr:hypothetical protein GGX14DRAFT_553380 [Mycena pura]